MKYDTFKDGPARIKLGIDQHYCQSKFANVLLSLHLAKTCHQDNIVSIVVDPGNIKSDLNRHTTSFLFKILVCSFSHVFLLSSIDIYGGHSNGSYCSQQSTDR